MNTPNLYEYLSKKLEQKRKEHPSFKLMEIDDNLFPNGVITFDTEKIKARDSNNELKTVKEIVAESWGKGSKNHLMIEGEGGIGKTVTLLSIPDKFTPSLKPFPSIYIPLHEVKEDFDTIEKYIRKRVLNNKEDLYERLLDLLDEPWNKAPKLLLLLDGFNEIAAENRQCVRDDIKYWSEFPGIQIVTSSRYDIHTYVSLSYDYSTIKLQPLSDRTVEDYLNGAGIPIPADSAVKKLITIPLLLTLYVKTELILRQRETRSSSFKKIENAGSIVWNYLQCELWRFGIEDEDAKNAIIAMEFVAPYMAWQMQQNSLFLLNKKQFNKYLEDAYKLLKNHFSKTADFPFHIQDALQKADGIPSLQLIRNLLEKHLCLFVENGEHYRLMHQQFRDAMAAMHLINSSYLSGDNLPKEWESPVDHYVMQFVADLISEEEANCFWELNRKTQPAIEYAMINQLRLQGLLHNNDFSHLDFSGLDLRNISLYPYRFSKATIKLPTQPERMEKTKLSAKTFSSLEHDWVIAVAVTPDGKHIVIGSHDGTIQVLDLETGTAIGNSIEGHKGSVHAVAVTPDGKRIVSGSYDRTIRVWDLETGAAIGDPIKGHEKGVTAVAVTSDGGRIVSRSWDRTIRVWDMESGMAIGKPIKRHEKGVYTVAITPDGKRIVSGSDDKTIRVWDLETGMAIGKPIKGHNSWVEAVAVTPDGKRIVSGSGDNTICVWDLKTGAAIRSPIKGHKSGVTTIAVTPDGKRIVSRAIDGTIRVWDLETGAAIGSLIKGLEGQRNAVAVTPDGKRIVSMSYDSTIHVWDLETGLTIGKLFERHKSESTALAVTPDGKHIVSGSHDSTIRVWDLETGAAIGKPIEGHTGRVTAIAVTPDGKRIVSGYSHNIFSRFWGGTIRVWDLETGTAIGNPIEGHQGWVYALAVTPDGKHIVSGSFDDTIRIWDLKTGAAIGKPIEGHKSSVIAVAVTLDGKRIVSGSDDCTIRVWNLETGAEIGSLGGHKITVTAVAVTLDGKRIVCKSDDRTFRVWDMETSTAIGKPIKWHGNMVTAVAVTPDGKHILSGGSDNTICIANIETLEVKTIKIHPLSFVDLDFSQADISDDELKETLRQNGAKV